MIKRVLVFLIIVISLFLIGFYYPKIQGYFVFDEENIYQKEEVFLKRSIDGDTIEVVDSNGEIFRVRLLGINTPEKNEELYEDAFIFLKRFENESVYILRDYEENDLYGRKLRYLFYEERFVNLEILEQGLATSFITEDLYYRTKILDAERYAMDNELGLWEKSQDICFLCVILEELNEKEEYFIIKNKCEFTCNIEGWMVKDAGTHFSNLGQDSIKSSEEIKVESKTNIWNNDGDRFFMRDDYGKLVVFYEY